MITGSTVSGVNMESVDRSVDYLARRKRAQRQAWRYWGMVGLVWAVAVLVAGIMYYLE